MAPMGKFKNSSNCRNFGCIQRRVVIFGSSMVFGDGQFNGVI